MLNNRRTGFDLALSSTTAILTVSLIAGCNDLCGENPGEASQAIKTLGVVLGDATVCARPSPPRIKNRKVSSSVKLWIWRSHHEVAVRYIRHFEGRGWRRVRCNRPELTSSDDRESDECFQHQDGSLVHLHLYGMQFPRFGTYLKAPGSIVNIYLYQ